MIFGSKGERFVQTIDSKQLRIRFEPQVVEIEETVKAELEQLWVSYLRKKEKKNITVYNFSYPSSAVAVVFGGHLSARFA